MHMKIAIIGAGAMGCLFACLLDNYEVTLYDVSPVAVERINRDGILLQEPDGTESRHRIPIRFSGEGQEPQDLVILFVKDTAGEAALRANLGLVGKDTVLLSLQTVWETLRSCNGTSPQSVFCLARHGTTASREHPALSTIPEPAKRRSAHRPAISQWQKQLPPYCPRMRPRWSPAQTSSACCGQN